MLDARLTEMINNKAFRAKLENGHEFVACMDKNSPWTGRPLRPGGKITVQFSPFDMSKAQILRDRVE